MLVTRGWRQRGNIALFRTASKIESQLLEDYFFTFTNYDLIKHCSVFWQPEFFSIFQKSSKVKRKPDLHDPELHLYSEGEEDIDDPNDPAYQKNDDDQDCGLTLLTFFF